MSNFSNNTWTNSQSSRFDLLDSEELLIAKNAMLQIGTDITPLVVNRNQIFSSSKCFVECPLNFRRIFQKITG